MQTLFTMSVSAGSVLLRRVRDVRRHLDSIEAGIASATFAFCQFANRAMAISNAQLITETVHTGANWAYTPKFGPDHHSQRWRSAP